MPKCFLHLHLRKHIQLKLQEEIAQRIWITDDYTQFRHRLGDYIIAEFGGKPSVVDDGATYSHLLSWELKPATPHKDDSPETSEFYDHSMVAPRLLEIGCKSFKGISCQPPCRYVILTLEWRY
jgi:hypothetical protein